MQLNNKILSIIIGLLLTVISVAQVPIDKQQHLAAGVLVGSTLTTMTINKSVLESLTITTLGTVTIGISKELYDINKTGFSWPDVAYTTAGGLLSWTIMKGIPEAIISIRTERVGKNDFFCVNMKIPIFKNKRGKIKKGYDRR